MSTFRFFIFSILLLPLTISCKLKVQDKQVDSSIFGSNVLPNEGFDISKTKQKAHEAIIFCKNRSYNSNFCILIDMSIHSGLNRFILWDFERDTVYNTFLVSHGCCDNQWGEDLSKTEAIFSNVTNSHCSSLGKYRIGERGYSNWGINVKYSLHGLEDSNNNAFSRYIVFHSWNMVTEEEVHPKGSPEGWGCPAISNKSMQLIDPLLRESSKPVLMWIYQ
ncbi:MAG: peptidase [Bacteroidetes bacterium]|nr:peptidase [Bacteroidota bacterium]